MEGLECQAELGLYPAGKEEPLNGFKASPWPGQMCMFKSLISH